MERTTRKPIKRHRRGVVAILAMMFLVLFGSLGVAMAIASKGNLRSASTHLQVIKATAAAETGLEIAEDRLIAAAARLVVAPSNLDGPTMFKVWNGTLASSSKVVLPPDGYAETAAPTGIASAIVNAFNAQQAGVATIALAPGAAPAGVYKGTYWVNVDPIAFEGVSTTDGKYERFSVQYAPLASGLGVRIIVTGYSSVTTGGDTAYAYGNDTGKLPITRSLYRDYTLIKRHKHAIVSPSRVMVGRGVSVEGSIGAAFAAVDKPKGDPLTMKSDFYGLSPILDAKLNDFFTGVKNKDGDGDGRLRKFHTVEASGLPPSSRDYDGNGAPDDAFADVTGDGYVDDYDIFLKHFDANGDGKLVLSAALTTGTPAAGLTAEFTADDDLARLIDSALPDRNKNFIYGWQDTNRNGKWDPGENLNDYDSNINKYPDRVLGWRDGFLDKKDLYAKVHGQVSFKVTKNAWETGQSHKWQQGVNGPIRSDRGTPPVKFKASAREMPDVAVEDMKSATTGLMSAADGAAFWDQVATQLGTTAGALPAYTEANPVTTAKRYFRANMDNAAAKALTGQNLFEKMPFNSPNYTDWYYRPRFENMVFKNVTIPRGVNGLFVNCTFVGATYVQTYGPNAHTNWSLYGRMKWDAAAGKPVPETNPLDKSDFLRYTTGVLTDGPANYSDFPDPPIIDGSIKTGAERDTKLYSNNIRFHSCLFVGSIVSDTPDVFSPVRQKLQFTGSTQFSKQHPTSPLDANLNPDASDLVELNKSSMILPQYSVELGQFNSPTDTFVGGPTPQNVTLSGTIITGVLDARGNTTIEGTLLMTFKPVLGQYPLMYNGVPVGNPANFNTTLGYFGPADGDEESLDPSAMPVVAGQKIVGYDTDGDGLADVPYTQAKPAGSTDVPFYGYGRVNVKWNPNIPMPNGIPLPITVVPVANSYREGAPW